MVSVCEEIERLDLLDGDLTFDTAHTIPHNVNFTMSFKLRQHGLGTPAVMALESGVVDHEQLMTWILPDVPQHGTLSE